MDFGRDVALALAWYLVAAIVVTIIVTITATLGIQWLWNNVSISVGVN